MKRLTLITISLIYFLSACSQNQTKRSGNSDIQSMRDELTFSIDDNKNIKALRIILSNDSIKLNNVRFQSVEQLLHSISKEFTSVYQHERLDSIIVIQLYFSPNIPNGVHDTVYYGIKKLYQNSWDFVSRKLYNEAYSTLNKDEIEMVKDKVPFYLNEYELILYKEK